MTKVGGRMERNQPFRDRICAMFEALGIIRCRPYLDACGLYYQEYFFGIITNDALYLRTNDFTKQWYVHRHMPAFPIRIDEHHLFYQVPQKMIDRPHLLMRLAREAIGVCRERVPDSPMPLSIDG